MRAEHLAIDGSVVAVEADADLNTKATAAGWAVVPSLMQVHPFAISPPSHSRVVEKALKGMSKAVEVVSVQDFRLKDGELRVAEIRVPTATGGVRELTVGAWEGEGGCLSTSLRGREPERLVEVFDTLEFGPRRGGLAIDSPVMAVPRAPEVIKEVPGFGILSVRPAVHGELDRVPKARGFMTDSGELFRLRKTSNAMMLVTRTAIVHMNPVGRHEGRDLVAVARTVRVEWQPRRAGAMN